MKKIKSVSLEDVLISFGIDLLAGLVLLVAQNFNPQLLQLSVPVWVLVMSVGFALTLPYISILRAKVNPFLKLVDDLRICINELDKYFHHPHYAIMPNPFVNEPNLWKYYENSFSGVLYTWYLSVKKRFETSNKRKDIDEDTLFDFSKEFCDIVHYYLVFSNAFKELTRTYPISDEIKENYNQNFVKEFGTILRPRIMNYGIELQRVTGKRLEDIEAPIELH